MSVDTSYLPRVIYRVLAQNLEYAGAVLVEGVKACGKTFTAEQAANSAVFLDVDQGAADPVAIDPGLVLDREPPTLVDEWQIEANRVWNHVRDRVNRSGRMGQFILTGSAVPVVSEAGRSGCDACWRIGSLGNQGLTPPGQVL